YLLHVRLFVFLFSCFSLLSLHSFLPFFFFTDTATTEIYTLSLHDALPISRSRAPSSRRRRARDNPSRRRRPRCPRAAPFDRRSRDRKSTRLNSSHGSISYAVFCLKKKKKKNKKTKLIKEKKKKKIKKIKKNKHII